jgi:hypothetical protein
LIELIALLFAATLCYHKHQEMLLTLDGWMQLLVDRTLGEALLVLRQRLHSVFAHCVQAPTKQLSPAHADTVRCAI